MGVVLNLASSDLPKEVLDRVAQDGQIVSLGTEPLFGGTGPANKGVARLQFTVQDGRELRRVDVVCKTLKPVAGGRHATLAGDQRHWAYWRREADAYGSGLLPSGPGLRAPVCFVVDGDDIYLEYLDGPSPSAASAADSIARWQVGISPELDRPWLARDQLGQRLAVTELDWSSVEADPRVVELWARRESHLETLANVPLVRSHGDFSLGNLRQVDTDVVAFDWASFGWEPIGFDLAHLALTSGLDPRPAYRAATPYWPAADIDQGFCCCLALIGSSRVHWMLTAAVDVPSWYADFLWEHRPT